MDLVAGDFFAKDIVAMLLVEELTEMPLVVLAALLATRAFLVLLRLVIKDFLWMAISFPPRKLLVSRPALSNCFLGARLWPKLKYRQS